MPRTVPLLLAMAAVAAGCASPPVGGAEVRRAPAPPERCSYSTVEFVRNFDTVDELVAGSTVVIVGRVVDEQIGEPRRAAVDVVSQSRTITVDVEEAIKGSPEQQVRVEAWGWDLVGDHRERGPACPWFEVGDRAVMALNPHHQRYGSTGAASEYRLVDGEVGDTQRSEPLAERLEAMSEQELITALRRAAR